MHITVEQSELKNILEVVARVSTKHVTLPVLQCVLLTVADNTLTISATNLEIGIEGSVSVKQEAEGVVAVSAQTLLSVVSLLTQKEVTLKTDGDVLVIEGKGSSSKINTTPHEEFPVIPRITEAGQKINPALFALGVKTTAFAASQSSIKPELGSVYIQQKKEHTLTFVATDSFRLMEKTIPQQGVVLEDAILIPYKNALELARVAELAGDDTELFINENQCAIASGNIYITSRLISGSFPDYQQIIPKEYSTHTTVLTKDLLQALKKTSVFLNKFMQLTMSVDGNSVVLSSQNGEVGTVTESITATTDGEPITLNFNQRYINEALPYIVDDSLTLHFAGIGRPMVFESVHDKTLRYLVMPMNK